MGSKPRIAVFVIAAAGMLGCASVPPPHERFATAQADVGRAEAAGAPSVPSALLHLRLATEDLDKAKQLMGSDNLRAALLSDVADTEAQLALALAHQVAARDEAAAAQAELQKNSRP